MSVRMRQFVERQVIAAFLESALEQGHNISVHNGEEVELWNSTSVDDIMSALMTTDEDHLYVDAVKGPQGTLDSLLGEVVLIYGNDGPDVINDYHVKLEPLMDKATQVADYWDSDGPWVAPRIRAIHGGV